MSISAKSPGREGESGLRIPPKEHGYGASVFFASDCAKTTYYLKFLKFDVARCIIFNCFERIANDFTRND